MRAFMIVARRAPIALERELHVSAVTESPL